MNSTIRSVFYLIALLGATALSAQPAKPAQDSHYYVVIGAFAKEENAKKFVGFVRSRFFQATYEKKPKSKLFFVYFIKTDDKNEAFTRVRVLQKDSAFADAWVYNGSLTALEQPVVKTEPKPADPVEPVVADTLAKGTEGVTSAEATQPDQNQIVVLPADTTSTVALVPDSTASMLPPSAKAKGKYFKFDVIGPDGRPFSGKVHNVDLKKGRDLAAYNSHAYNDIVVPSSQREEPMTFICGIFGYKEIMQLVDYNNPSLTEGVTKDSHEAWVVPFKLERLNKGDVSVMYNVSFYKDAVVMLPRAQEELDELVNLMKSNPAYEIRIHGHTNGNDKRKIIALGESRNYFTIKGSVEKNGTAKELSKDRAEAVKQYLVEHGIAADRMDIMAWGGTNMLVKETSSSARLNDRIEIEIMKD